MWCGWVAHIQLDRDVPTADHTLPVPETDVAVAAGGVDTSTRNPDADAKLGYLEGRVHELELQVDRLTSEVANLKLSLAPSYQ